MANTVLGKRIEFFVGTLVLQMLYDAVFGTDNEFLFSLCFAKSIIPVTEGTFPLAANLRGNIESRDVFTMLMAALVTQRQSEAIIILSTPKTRGIIEQKQSEEAIIETRFSLFLKMPYK